MSYPGNSSLSPDVRKRITTTFEQTLDLASEGKRKEASLGCDFILRMDPRFEPARELQKILAGNTGPVDVSSLRSPLSDSGAAKVQEAEALFGDLDDLDLGDEPPVPATAEDLQGALSKMLERRDFSGLLALAQRAPADLLEDGRVSALVEAATNRRESAPYVQKFLESARQALDTDDHESAQSFFEKAESLDPSHPGLNSLRDRIRVPMPVEDPLAGLDLTAPEAEPEVLEIEAPPMTSFTEPAAAPPVTGDATVAIPSSQLPPVFSGGNRSEGAERIQGLLAEGDAAFQQADYQAAIDAWSRIFLIDVDHDEASRRIEEARRLKAERERQVEEVFHEAVMRLEAGDTAAAQQGLQQVLELQPTHLTAREYLDQMAEGGMPAITPRPVQPVSGPVAVEDPLLPSIDENADLPLGNPTTSAVPIPPPPPAPEAAPAPVKASGGASRRFLMIGAAVFVLACALLFFLFQNRQRLFPNAREEAPVAQAEDPIARATRLHDEGKVQVAIQMLRRMPPVAPQYDAAQALISQWEAESQEAESPVAEEVVEEPAPEIDLAARSALLAAAREQLDARQSLWAREYLEEARAMAPLEGEELDLEGEIERRLEPIRRWVVMFEEGEYEFVLPELWRLHQEDPTNPDLRRLITDSYYNLAVSDLQRGDAKNAAEKFREALALTPGEPVIQRHSLFAEAYNGETKDLLYRIYVKYLPLR
ncbi:MAG: hypothetical protein AAF604_07515 [Acidobacteriota bacterium]